MTHRHFVAFIATVGAFLFVLFGLDHSLAQSVWVVLLVVTLFNVLIFFLTVYVSSDGKFRGSAGAGMGSVLLLLIVLTTVLSPIFSFFFPMWPVVQVATGVVGAWVLFFIVLDVL